MSLRGSGALDPSFEELVVEHSKALLRRAYVLTGDRGYAEDLLQTTLLRTAWRWAGGEPLPGGVPVVAGFDRGPGAGGHTIRMTGRRGRRHHRSSSAWPLHRCARQTHVSNDLTIRRQSGWAIVPYLAPVRLSRLIMPTSDITPHFGSSRQSPLDRN